LHTHWAHDGLHAQLMRCDEQGRCSNLPLPAQVIGNAAPSFCVLAHGGEVRILLQIEPSSIDQCCSELLLSGHSTAAANET